MPFYKDKAKKVHFLESENKTEVLPEGFAEITKDEAEALIAPTQEQITNSENNAAKVALAAIDAASIRALREYIASKSDAPQILKEKEASAIAARAKIK